MGAARRCPPNGANQDQALLKAGEAHGPAEARQTCLNNSRTRFFGHLAAECIPPGLLPLRTTTRPSPAAPSLLISTTSFSAVIQKALAPCGVPEGATSGGCQTVNQSPAGVETNLATVQLPTRTSPLNPLYRTAPNQA